MPVYHYGLQFQLDNSMKYGLYVLMFVHYISLYGMKQFTNFIYKFHSKQKLSYNDKYFTRYCFRYLSKSPCSHWKSGNKRAMTYKECISYIGIVTRPPLE